MSTATTIAARPLAAVGMSTVAAPGNRRVAFVAGIVYLVRAFAAGGRWTMDGGR